MRNRFTALVLLCAGAMTASLPGHGSATAQAFKGKQIKMVINYGAGGNADTEGRIFQRHLSKHLEGKPTIIVQNLPGAGGLTAINQMGLGIGFKEPELTVGFATFNAIAPLIDDPALKVKVDTFNMIMGIGQWYVIYARKDILPGNQQPADFAKVKSVFGAGYSRSSNHDIRMRLMLELFGVDHKIVTGFKSIGAVNKAMAQKEIVFMMSTLPGYETHAQANLIGPGIAVPLWQLAAIGPDGKPQLNPVLAKRGIKSFEEVYKDATGKAPSGPTYEALKLTSATSSKIARVIMMPPGAPKAAVEEMRKGFANLVKDPDFLAEYRRIIKMDPLVSDAKEVEFLLKETLRADPKLKQVLKVAAGVK